MVCKYIINSPIVSWIIGGFFVLLQKESNYDKGRIREVATIGLLERLFLFINQRTQFYL